jgi:hypothetical protein
MQLLGGQKSPSLCLQLASDSTEDVTGALLPGHEVVFVEKLGQTTVQRLAESSKVFSLDACTGRVLISQMVKCLIETLRITEQVDAHVHSVEDAHAVGREDAAIWVLNIDVLEQVFRSRVVHENSLQQETSNAGAELGILASEQTSPLLLDNKTVACRAAVIEWRLGDGHRDRSDQQQQRYTMHLQTDGSFKHGK